MSVNDYLRRLYSDDELRAMVQQAGGSQQPPEIVMEPDTVPVRNMDTDELLDTIRGAIGDEEYNRIMKATAIANGVVNESFPATSISEQLTPEEQQQYFMPILRQMAQEKALEPHKESVLTNATKALLRGMRDEYLAFEAYTPAGSQVEREAARIQDAVNPLSGGIIAQGFYGAVRMLPTIGASIGAGAVTGGVGSTAYLAARFAPDAYDRAVEAGVSKPAALALAGVEGLVNGVLERLQIVKLLPPEAVGTAGKLLRQTLVKHLARVGGKNAQRMLDAAVKAAARETALPEIVGRMLYGAGAFTQESFIEAAQQAVSEFGTHVAHLIGGTERPALKQSLKNISDSFTGALAVFPWLLAPSMFGGLGASVAKYRRQARDVLLHDDGAVEMFVRTNPDKAKAMIDSGETSRSALWPFSRVLSESDRAVFLGKLRDIYNKLVGKGELEKGAQQNAEGTGTQAEATGQEAGVKAGQQEVQRLRVQNVAENRLEAAPQETEAQVTQEVVSGMADTAVDNAAARVAEKGRIAPEDAMPPLQSAVTELFGMDPADFIKETRKKVRKFDVDALRQDENYMTAMKQYLALLPANTNIVKRLMKDFDLSASEAQSAAQALFGADVDAGWKGKVWRQDAKNIRKTLKEQGIDKKKAKKKLGKLFKEIPDEYRVLTGEEKPKKLNIKEASEVKQQVKAARQEAEAASEPTLFDMTKEVSPDEINAFMAREPAAIRLLLDGIPVVKRFAKKAAKRFKNPSDLPYPAWEVTQKWEGFMAKWMAYGELLAKKLIAAHKQALGVTADFRQLYKDPRGFAQAAIEGIAPEYGRVYNEILQGKRPLEDAPEHVRPILKEMRLTLDSFSALLTRSDVVPDTFKETVINNLGVWLKRSYLKWADPKAYTKYVKNLSAETVEKLRSTVRNILEDQIRRENRLPEDADVSDYIEDGDLEAMVEHILFSGIDEQTGQPIGVARAFDTLSRVTRRDLRTLLRRKDLDEAIRVAWGEIDNPIYNFMSSLHRVVQFVSSDFALNDLVKTGSGRFLFTKPTIGEDGTQYIHAVDLKPRMAFSPLVDPNMYAGKKFYTTAEIAKALSKFQSIPMKEYSAIVRAYMSMIGLAKRAATIYYHTAQVRNHIGSLFKYMENGHFDMKDWPHAVMIGLHEFGPNWAARWGELLGKTPEQIAKAERQYLQSVESGLIGKSPVIYEAMALKKGAITRDWMMQQMRLANPNMLKALIDTYGRRKILGFMNTLYSFGDDVPRIMFAMSEYRKYRKVYPELPENEVWKIAVRNTHNLFWNYDMTPASIKEFGRLAPFGPFIAFRAEAYRTAVNLADQIITELRNPRTKDIGVQRLASALAMRAVMPALHYFSRLLLGVTNDEDKAIREFLPSWSRNSFLLYLGKGPNRGQYKFIDLTWSTPYQETQKAIMALLRGDNVRDAVWDAFLELTDPFLDPQVALAPLEDVIKYNAPSKYEDSKKWLYDVVTRFGEAFVPGSFKALQRQWHAFTGTVERSGIQRSPWIELFAQFGFRTTSINIDERMGRRFWELGSQLDEAYRRFRRIAVSPGTVDEGDIVSAYQRSIEESKRIAKRIATAAERAMRSVDDRDRVIAAMTSAGMSETLVKQALQGEFVPYLPTRKLEEAVLMRAPEKEAEGRIKLLRSLYTNYLKEYMPTKGSEAWRKALEPLFRARFSHRPRRTKRETDDMYRRRVKLWEDRRDWASQTIRELHLTNLDYSWYKRLQKEDFK